jgi:hypothetical protein
MMGPCTGATGAKAPSWEEQREKAALTGEVLLCKAKMLVEEAGIPGLQIYTITEGLESPVLHRRSILGLVVDQRYGDWVLQTLHDDDGEERATTISEHEAADVLQQLLELV